MSNSFRPGKFTSDIALALMASVAFGSRGSALTPEQEKKRELESERDAWNRAVEEKKQAKKRAQGKA